MALFFRPFYYGVWTPKNYPKIGQFSCSKKGVKKGVKKWPFLVIFGGHFGGHFWDPLKHVELIFFSASFFLKIGRLKGGPNPVVGATPKFL